MPVDALKFSPIGSPSFQPLTAEEENCRYGVGLPSTPLPCRAASSFISWSVCSQSDRKRCRPSVSDLNFCTAIEHTLYFDLFNPSGDIMLASSKTQRVDLRISPAAKAMIQAAAQAQDKTVSEFLLDSGLTSAAETLADRRLFILDDTQWSAFQAALDAPPRERPRLARLMATGK